MCSGLFSQISSPDLRCLQVLPNGDVQLTWIPPSDPSNVFSSYEIFSSISASGPFSSVGSVGVLGFTTFTHTGAGANVQSIYYFVKTHFGAGGTSTTQPKDTLRTIRLNVTQSSPALSIVYNNLHQPALNSSSPTFTIAKEYPLGTWNILGTSANVKFVDTISVCSDSLNYQVSQSDISGCVSTSNIKGGIFHDTKPPDEPVVDSISVLPNGNTVLSWSVPRDMDVVKYYIYHNVSGTYPQIDSTLGRLNTTYTYANTTANSQTVALYVSAIDSCHRYYDGFDTKPVTMFMLAVYDRCNYSTTLTWNPYQGMLKGILEYRIYYSVNGGAYTRIGSTKGTSFVHTNADPSKNLSYFVRVVNTDQTITSSSNRYNFFSTQAVSPGFVYIRNATIKDDHTAEINLYLDTSKGSTGIDVTRSVDGINYSNIAFLPFNGTPNYSYTDPNISSNSTSYYYQAVLRDSCGNPRAKSGAHKTVLLTEQDDKENVFAKHLKWTDYKGFAGSTSGYNIYRVINDVQAGSPIGTTGPADTTYTDDIEDEAPNGSKIEYIVEAVEGIGNPYGFEEKALSNKVRIYMEGRMFVPTAFAPKGVNKLWLPVTHFVDKSEYKVRIFNKWGAKIFETDDDKQGWDGKDATADVYVYLISYKNSRGEYIEVKGTFVLLL